MDKMEAKQVCHTHMHRYVRVVIADGRCFDGFVENVDDEQLCLAVPVGHEMLFGQTDNSGYPENNSPVGVGYGNQAYGQQRDYGPTQGGQYWGGGAYPGVESRAFFPGYYPSPYYGYNPYGRRRFNRLALPLVALTALSVLPFF